MDSLARYRILNTNIGIIKPYLDARYPSAEIVMQMELITQTAKRLNRLVSSVKSKQNEGLTTVRMRSKANPSYWSKREVENFAKANT